MNEPLEWVGFSPLCERCARILHEMNPANPVAYLNRVHALDHHKGNA